jgi:hypothetical protein
VDRASRTRRSSAAHLVVAAVAATTVVIAIAGCGKGVGTSGPGTKVGYVDLEKIIEAHPLHVELDSLQNQITLLSGQAQNAPQAQTPAQAQAQERMQADLAAADQQFQIAVNQRRMYYSQRENAAIGALQSQASGVSAPIGQQYGAQAQKIQTDAIKAYGDYQKQLFAADNAHLREVSRQLQQENFLKLEARRKQYEKQETDYQIGLAKQSQSQRLNLKTKLEDLNLPADERAQDTSQLSNIETREEAMTNQLKTRDNADLRAYQDSLQRDAAARFNEARTESFKETQTKLIARQKQTNDQLRTQMSGIGTQYQKQVAIANAALQKDPKLKAQADAIHNANQAAYTLEFDRALASYEQTRKALVAKYSAIAGMQFQDSAELTAEAQRLTQQRQDLYGKIVEQVQSQVGDIARSSDIGVVLTSVRGAGSAIDLTDKVLKAIAALPAVAPSPPSTTSSPATSSSPSAASRS